MKSHVYFFFCLGDERVHKLAVCLVEHVNRFLHIVLQLIISVYLQFTYIKLHSPTPCELNNRVLEAAVGPKGRLAPHRFLSQKKKPSYIVGLMSFT